MHLIVFFHSQVIKKARFENIFSHILQNLSISGIFKINFWPKKTKNSRWALDKVFGSTFIPFLSSNRTVLTKKNWEEAFARAY